MAENLEIDTQRRLFTKELRLKDDISTEDGSTIIDGANGNLKASNLDSDTVTVAGNSVSLGNSTTVDYADLNDTSSSFPIVNSDLANSSITVAGNGVSLGGSTAISHSDLSDRTSVANGTVTLSSGSAVVSTGVTSTGTNLNVLIDPSGNGSNSSDVKASARAFWDNSAGEYKVEILEDGTSIGNPDIGYKVVSD